MTSNTTRIDHSPIERFEGEGGTTGAGELSRKKHPSDANQLAKSIVDIGTGKTDDREPTPEEHSKDPAVFSFGRDGSLNGGKARAVSMTARYRSEIAKAAAKGRWLLKD